MSFCIDSARNLLRYHGESVSLSGAGVWVGDPVSPLVAVSGFGCFYHAASILRPLTNCSDVLLRVLPPKGGETSSCEN